ncbi:MAG TPA: ester cyclase [Candidatus Kapabacteria bacterium]|nr:ester cyclase [Candidatus Kapabacteria bacterium]
MKHFFSACIVCLCAVSIISCNKGGGAAGAADSGAIKADSTKKAQIAAYMAVNDMFNTGKFDDMGKYIEANYVEHNLHPGEKPGLDGLKEHMTMLRAAFPDVKFTINNITADSNMIWALMTITGTNSGPFMGMPATGKAINFQGVDIVKLQNGKCTDHWGFYQDMKMMEQMGMMPPMGGHPDMKEAPKGKS